MLITNFVETLAGPFHDYKSAPLDTSKADWFKPLEEPNLEMCALVNNYPGEYGIVSALPETAGNLVVEFLQKWIPRRPPIIIIFKGAGCNTSNVEMKFEVMTEIFNDVPIRVCIDSSAAVCAMYRKLKLPVFHFVGYSKRKEVFGLNGKPIINP